MTILEQVIRYLRRVHWMRERRRRQRQMARALPSIVYRGEKIEIARKTHRPCKSLIEAQKAEMTAALRGS